MEYHMEKTPIFIRQILIQNILSRSRIYLRMQLLQIKLVIMNNIKPIAPLLQNFKINNYLQINLLTHYF